MPSPRTALYIGEDLATSATENLIVLPYYGTDLQIEVAGYISKLLGWLTEALSGGTLDVRKKLNGTQVAVELLEFAGSDDRYLEATFAAGVHPLAIGDRLAFDAITSSFGPTTGDLILGVEITPT